ncbi:MAG: hypothetical protein ACLUI3_06235 [Christensenellales bacterium]
MPATGTRPEFKAFVQDFAKAAQTWTFLRQMKVGVIGKMPGMNDILADDMSILKKIDSEYRYDCIGSVVQYMNQTTKEEIDARIAWDREHFVIDPSSLTKATTKPLKCTSASKSIWMPMAWTHSPHSLIFLPRMALQAAPLLAASHLMADGYGYAAEGDSLCAAMVATAHCIGDDDGNFTEMYSMDFGRNAIIFCHAGEGNWSTHRTDVPPQIIDRYLGEGGLANPPTPRFTPRVGRATLTSPAPVWRPLPASGLRRYVA